MITSFGDHLTSRKKSIFGVHPPNQIIFSHRFLAVTMGLLRVLCVRFRFLVTVRGPHNEIGTQYCNQPHSRAFPCVERSHMGLIVQPWAG
jgi:hypothetical protein